MSNHPRDCPHGRQLGHCDTCDLLEAQAELTLLRAVAGATKVLVGHVIANNHTAIWVTARKVDAALAEWGKVTGC